MALRRVARCICVALPLAAGACAPRADDASVSISPESVDLSPRMTFTFGASVEGTFGDAVTWALSGPAVAAGHPERLGAIDANGVYVAPDELPPPGQDIVTVVVRSDVSDASATATIQLSPVPMNPASGISAGGTRVTFSGPEIGPGTTVTFDGIPASNGVITGTQIEVTAPPHAIGAVDVEVAGPGGTRRYPLAFHYEATGFRLGPSAWVFPPCSGANVNAPATGAITGGDALADLLFPCAGFETPSSQTFMRNVGGGAYVLDREEPANGLASAIGDFDGDGLLDAFAMGFGGIEGGEVAWGTAPGEIGAFETAVVDTSLQGSPIFVFVSDARASDADGDGAFEITLADASAGVFVSADYDISSGAFRPVIAASPNGTTSGDGWLVDVDGAGGLDAVFRRDDVLGFDVLRRGESTVTVPSASLVVGAAAGQMIGSDDRDLAVVLDDGTVDVYEGPGFDLAATLDGDFIAAIAVHDVDGDGIDDLVASAMDDFLLFRGAAPGLFAVAERVGVPGGEIATALEVVDVDGEAPPDLLLQSFGLTQVIRGRNLEPGPFWGPSRVMVTTSSANFIATRVTPQGETEAVINACTPGLSGLCSLLRVSLDGEATVAILPSTSSSIARIVTHDIEADGIEDVAFVCGGGADSDLCVARGMPDGTLAEIETFPVPGNASVFALGDVDRDGLADAVVSSGLSGGLFLLRGTQTGMSAAVSIDDGAYQALALGDLDGDDSLDLVAVESALDRPRLFRGDGAGGFSLQSTLAALEGVREVRIRDLDRDFRPDLMILTASFFAASELFVLRGLGGFEFDDEDPYPLFSNAQSLELADLDRDGELDVVLTDDLPTVLPSRGGFRLFEAPRQFGAAPYGSGAVGDADGDGFPDLVRISGSVGPGSYLQILRNESF